MLLLWYPRPYFHAAGGQTLLLLLIGVDVVVGPLLTLIVFDPRKKRLKFDLAVIAVLQVAALAYGGYDHVRRAARVYVAFVGDRFELVAANAIDAARSGQGAAGVPRAAADRTARRRQRGLPTNPRELDDAAHRPALFGVSIGIFPQHLRSLRQPVAAASCAQRAAARDAARASSRKRAAEIDRVRRARAARPESELGYLPLQARHRDLAVIVDGDQRRSCGHRCRSIPGSAPSRRCADTPAAIIAGAFLRAFARPCAPLRGHPSRWRFPPRCCRRAVAFAAAAVAAAARAAAAAASARCGRAGRSRAGVTAAAYVLLDVTSGQVIVAAERRRAPRPGVAHQADDGLPRVRRAARQDDHAVADGATVSRAAWRAEGSRMFIEPRKAVSVDELLRGMIVQSGNDASIALAELVAGSEEAFVANG